MESVSASSIPWFPVAMSLLGAIAGFASKALLDLLADSRRSKAESAARKEARSEAARLRMIVFQRDTLIELQETLGRLVRMHGRCHFEDASAYRATGIWGKNQLGEPLNTDIQQSTSRVVLLSSRVNDEDIRHATQQFKEAANQVMSATGERESEVAMAVLGIEKSPHLLNRIGAVLRELDRQEFELES